MWYAVVGGGVECWWGKNIDLLIWQGFPGMPYVDSTISIEIVKPSCREIFSVPTICTGEGSTNDNIREKIPVKLYL